MFIPEHTNNRTKLSRFYLYVCACICIYIHIYIYVTVIIRQKEVISLRQAGMWKELEGGDLFETGGRKEVIMFD